MPNEMGYVAVGRGNTRPALHSRNRKNIIPGKITNFATPTAVMSA